MAVGRFSGIYVTAEPATNYIDAATITSGCELLREAGEMLNSTGDNLKEIAGDLGPDTLSVQGLTMQQPLEECGASISAVNGQLENLAEQIMSALQLALDKKQQELNEDAIYRDAAEHERRSRV